MTVIKIIVHSEDAHWWAESPDVPGFAVTGENLAEIRARYVEALEFFLGESVQVEEVAALEPNITVGAEFITERASAQPATAVPHVRQAALFSHRPHQGSSGALAPA